jgi:hypothetical protein
MEGFVGVEPSCLKLAAIQDSIFLRRRFSCSPLVSKASDFLPLQYRLNIRAEAIV